MLEGIGLFRGIMTKMDWLDQNQRVLSENIANSDTPGFQPRVLKQKDFKSFMGRSLEGGSVSVAPVQMSATERGHFGFNESEAVMADTKQKNVYESSPDNNGVVLEEQLYRANLNKTDYDIAASLYRRNVGMLRMAIQGSGR